MDIHITWTKIIVTFAGWSALRYLYNTFMKYITGCTDTFDPTVPFDAAFIVRDESREIRWELNREREKAALLGAENERLKIKLSECHKNRPHG